MIEVKCDACQNTMRLVDPPEVQELRAKLDCEAKAAGHWMKEANQEHNENVRLVAKLNCAQKALERYANRPDGMIEVDRFGNPQPCLTEPAREALKIIGGECIPDTQPLEKPSEAKILEGISQIVKTEYFFVNHRCTEKCNQGYCWIQGLRQLAAQTEKDSKV